MDHTHTFANNDETNDDACWGKNPPNPFFLRLLRNDNRNCSYCKL